MSDPSLVAQAPNAFPYGTVGVFLVTTFIACVLIDRMLSSSINKIPGPWYLKLSTVPLKWHDARGQTRLWVHDLHMRYGPVVAIAPSYVHFATAAAAKIIYTNGGKDFLKTELYDVFRQEGHENLFTAIEPKKHAMIRRGLADRYSNSNILASKVIESINERADTFVQACTRTPSVDIYFYLHAYALDCVTSILFHPHGTRSLDQTDDKRIIQYMSYREGGHAWILEHYLPVLSKVRAYLNPEADSDVTADKLIRDYVREMIDRDDLSDFTVATRIASLKSFDKELAVAECLDHLGAGLETTGDTLCWLIWELSQPRNAERMDKLHTELKDVPANAPLDKLPYLELVIQEALRLYAPGTQSLPRYVPSGGREIEGYFIPAHTTVACQSFTMHREPQSFPDAESFLPERWSDTNGNVERQRLNMSFGLGARSCIGRYLALAEMRSLLHAVYSKYRTSPATDMTASMHFADTVLTSYPKDKLCKISFTLYDE
ncbi:putative sterigmatocystin biosynthesis P450 monooxygenase stcF [Cercospora beticola]|uniref:Putative sterigmatocystin biosynthesis P450 monooxygenase stcF n=1 Tax=Cercospora beticola TaxID=122368 RepID=A0A2G5HXV4_CERBT|nr:putative sterigmatocystin biosynthesis P450 monooxygenase stcF [Cercospora beticola]PIA97113.1 putative sterigmatocystin biosynthesis P450 monooxygenase stcF [Cercospora beticola]CAK1360690.1 unnamed protein product [Cercospora beticola]